MVKTDYGHEKSWWDAKAKREEIDKFDEQINRALRWKEIKKHLSSEIKSILDLGAGTGAFSIPLAEMGYSVVHFDLDEMIAMAKKSSRKSRTTSHSSRVILLICPCMRTMRLIW